MQKIQMYNAHCCGEVGDVVVGTESFNFHSPKEGSEKLFQNQLMFLVKNGIPMERARNILSQKRRS